MLVVSVVLAGCGETLRSSSHLLAGLPCFQYPFLFGSYRWLPVGDKLSPAAFVVFGNHLCLLPVYPALSKDPRRASIRCEQVVSFVRCSLIVLSTLETGSLWSTTRFNKKGCQQHQFRNDMKNQFFSNGSMTTCRPVRL